MTLKYMLVNMLIIDLKNKIFTQWKSIGNYKMIYLIL